MHEIFPIETISIISELRTILVSFSDQFVCQAICPQRTQIGSESSYRRFYQVKYSVFNTLQIFKSEHLGEDNYIRHLDTIH